MLDILSPADNLFSGDAFRRYALHRADVFVRFGDIDWFAEA